MRLTQVEREVGTLTEQIQNWSNITEDRLRALEQGSVSQVQDLARRTQEEFKMAQTNTMEMRNAIKEEFDNARRIIETLKNETRQELTNAQAIIESLQKAAATRFEN